MQVSRIIHQSNPYLENLIPKGATIPNPDVLKAVGGVGVAHLLDLASGLYSRVEKLILGRE